MYVIKALFSSALSFLYITFTGFYGLKKGYYKKAFKDLKHETNIGGKRESDQNNKKIKKNSDFLQTWSFYTEKRSKDGTLKTVLQKTIL